MRHDHFTMDAMGYNNAPRPDAPPETTLNNEWRMGSRSSLRSSGKIGSVMAGSPGRFQRKVECNVPNSDRQRLRRHGGFQTQRPSWRFRDRRWREDRSGGSFHGSAAGREFRSGGGGRRLPRAARAHKHAPASLVYAV